MKRLQIFFILFINAALLLMPKTLVNACGFYVPSGEYRFWLLQPDLTNQRDLTPFFFASTYLYKGGEKIDEAGSNPGKNIDEWLAHLSMLKAKVTRKDIDELLDHTDPADFFEQPDSLARTNSFVRFLQERPHAGYFRYMLLSKKIEQIAANPDPWDEGAVRHANYTRIIDEAETLYRQTTSGFIKLRTAFQLMRLYGFNADTTAVRKVYDERIQTVNTTSWIKSAALYNKAMRGTIPGGLRDRLLAQVFDRGDYNRSYCLINIRSSRIDSLVKTTPNTHEKVVLQAMKAFNYPGRSLSYLQSIYEAEPAYHEIPFLLLREINKTEDWLMTGKVTGFKPAVYHDDYLWTWTDEWLTYDKSNWLADQAYAKRLNEFLLRLISEKKASQPALLHVYASYLSMLLGDDQQAGQQLDLASHYPQLPENVKTQIDINRFLLSLEKNASDISIESDLLELLNRPARKLAVHDPDLMRDQLILYTARKMIRQGSRAKGLMLLGRTRRAIGELPISTYKDVYEEIAETARPADYDTMVAILDHRRKTPFEQFITQGKIQVPLQYYSGYDSSYNLTWDRNRLLDGKTSWYIRNNNLREALRTLRNIPDTCWLNAPYRQYTGGNPFYLDIYKQGLYHGKRPDAYNKREIVEKMLELQTRAASSASKRAECHFQLANAWYNFSWYGNNWLMIKPWWSMHELDGYDKVQRSDFNDIYYGCSRARDLYLLAMRESRDKRLAALCRFMAGQCDSHMKRYIWLTNHPDEARHTGAKDFSGIPAQYLSCDIYQDYIRTFDRD